MKSVAFGNFICIFAFLNIHSCYVSAYFNPYTQVTPTPTTPRPLGCPLKGSLLIGGNKCIFVEKNPLSWQESALYCHQLGHKLLEITTGNLYFEIINALRTNGLLGSSYWIGAAKLKNRWCWVSNCLPIHPTFWAVTILAGKGVKEPIDSSRKSCALLDLRRSHFMNTESCSTKQPFICESNLFIPPVGTPQSIQPILHPSIHPRPVYWPSHVGFGLEDSDLPCPEDWEFWKEGSSCYLIESASHHNQSMAENLCHNEDGHLVSIGSSEENDFLTEILHNYHKEIDMNFCGWIGIKSTEEGFTLLNGDELPIENWHHGQPDLRLSMHPCVCADHDGLWLDELCSAHKGYICEREAIHI